jgi:anthocyanidin reductase
MLIEKELTLIWFDPTDDMEKNSHLKDLQKLGPLTVFRADMDEEGSFDDAVAGCDYVFLVAAPLHFEAQDPEVRKHAS